MMTDAPTPSKQVILLFSYEYVNLNAARAALSKLPDSKFSIASKNGLGRTLLNSTEFPATPIKWTPTYSQSSLESDFSSALLFWDGSGDDHKPGEVSLYQSARFFSERSIPFTIIGPDAKVVAPSAFYATFQNGESKMSTQSQPTVIVDAPKPAETYGQGQSKESKIRVQLHLPESTYNRYEEQAKSVKLPIEKILSDRLRSCVEHTSGRGLYLNDEQRSKLERMTGGHLILDAESALVKIHTTVSLKVGDVTIELNERVLARCASRARSERKSFEEYVKREVIHGLERSTGLRPY